MEGGFFTGDFERKLKFCIYQGMCKRRLWKWASLHRGPLGNVEGGSFTRDFERQMKEGSGNGVSMSMGAL